MAEVLIYGTIAGLTIPLGDLLSRQDWIRPAWVASDLRHAILAFGAGALLAAVTLVLVPVTTMKLPDLKKSPNRSICLRSEKQ